MKTKTFKSEIYLRLYPMQALEKYNVFYWFSDFRDFRIGTA